MLYNSDWEERSKITAIDQQPKLKKTAWLLDMQYSN